MALSFLLAMAVPTYLTKKQIDAEECRASGGILFSSAGDRICLHPNAIIGKDKDRR